MNISDPEIIGLGTTIAGGGGISAGYLLRRLFCDVRKVMNQSNKMLVDLAVVKTKIETALNYSDDVQETKQKVLVLEEKIDSLEQSCTTQITEIKSQIGSRLWGN